MSTMRFDGRVAIVTGAGGNPGLGRAHAMLLAARGAKVVVNDLGVGPDGSGAQPHRAEDVVDEIVAAGGEAVADVHSVAEEEGAQAIVETAIDTWGRLDILVNNAGGSPTKGTLDTEVAEVESSFHFNVSVPLELSRLVAPHMLAVGSGAIVNIGSVAGKHANRATLAHSLTKAAIAQLTRLTAADFSPRIRVNAVLPGAIETAALLRWLDSKGDDARTAMVANTPMRRNGTPNDIAAAVLFLASPAASWITGKLLEVDGGAVASVLPSQIPDL
jgi:7-alpha-hydroxysteroid dehydrogenase